MARKKQEINPECGKRLKSWLDFAGLTAQTLCKAINYTPQYMSDVITGKKRLPPDLAKTISNMPSFYVDGSSEIKINLPQDKRVRKEYLLCEDEYMTELHELAAYEKRSIARVSGVTSVIESHGYSVETLDTSRQNVKEYNMIMSLSGREEVDGVVKIKAPNGKDLFLPYKQWVLFEDEISQYIKFKTESLFAPISVFSEYVVTKEVPNG